MNFKRLRLLALLPLCLAGSALMAQTALPALHWRLVGPFRGGRTRAAAGVPGKPNVFYIGQVDGGVWKTNDYGRTWRPIFDAEPTQSIGAIAVAPSDPKTLYVASGEGLHRPDLSVGNGIYRSDDSGATWTHLGLREGQQIPALAVDPQNPNRLFAAVLGHPYGPNAERGIYRSTDGGKTWEKVLYKDENTGGSDVVIDPKNPQTVYASLWESRLGPWEDGNEYDGANGGLFKSTDGGTTWKKLTNGLPSNLVQINIALAASDPQRLYATVSTPADSGYASGKGLGVYRSDDGGESWRVATDDPRPAMKIGGGDLPVPRVDPQNPDVLYSTSIVTMKSTDGGKTWVSWRGAPGGDDYQNMWISPQNPHVILLVSDQGAVITVNGGKSWSSWYNQPTAQLYHVAVTNTFPYKICAGQQESGSVCIDSRGNDGAITYREWHPVGVIEYGYVAPDPLHPRFVYGAGRTEVSKYDFATGQVQNVTPIPLRSAKYRADRTEPILFSPVDPHVMYYAANVLFKTSDGGRSWQTISPDLSREHTGTLQSVPALTEKDQEKRRGAIYSLAASYKNLNTLWAGTDDGLLWRTTDGGANWKNITPPGLPTWSKVTQIDASRFDDETSYVSVSRMRADDMKPYIFRTHDGGATWQAIVSGLPADAPVNTVRQDPLKKGLLYAGTETGVYVSLDDGDHWQPLEYNLPHTSMRDLMVKDDDLIVATHGRAFWVLDGIAPLRQMAEVPAGAPYLFASGAAWRVRRSTYTDTPLPPDEPAGQNPPDGALIDYSLPQQVSGPVVVEILDAQGKVVRRYSSEDKPELTPEELDKQLIPTYWVKEPTKVSAAPGMHRLVWDMHYTRPVAAHYDYPISAVPHETPREPLGPLALPGAYTVRLIAAGKTLTQPLTIRMDPRVSTAPAGLQAMFDAQVKLAAMLSESSEAAMQAHSLREQLADRKKQAQGALAASIEELDKQLEAAIDGSKETQVPGLDDVSGEAAALYTQTGQADAAPTTAQADAATHLGEELPKALDHWKQLNGTAIPALNEKLRAAHLAPLNPERQPDNMPETGDED